MEEKLTYEEFFRRSVLKLRNAEKSRGIHSVYSGFNQAFRDYFGEDPIPVTQELVKQGKIVTRPVRGGAMIYLPDEAPAQPRSALSRIMEGVAEGVKPTHSEFFRMAIEKLRNVEKSRGIHSVYSGFNQAFREHFNEDPILVTQELVKQGKIVTRPVKGGAMIYLPEEAPAQPQSALSLILAGTSADRKLTHEEFFKEAVAKLRTPGKSRGIHSVYSGFNQAFRDYFGEDPISVTQKFAAEGKIVTRPVKGGAMIYLPEEAPVQARSVLAKILE